MSKFDHPHIIRLIGVCTDRSPIFIVMELCEKGSLREYLQKNENYFDQQNLHLIRYVKQLASALSYLESQSFVHRYETFKDPFRVGTVPVRAGTVPVRAGTDPVRVETVRTVQSKI